MDGECARRRPEQDNQGLPPPPQGSAHRSCLPGSRLAALPADPGDQGSLAIRHSRCVGEETRPRHRGARDWSSGNNVTDVFVVIQHRGGQRASEGVGWRITAKEAGVLDGICPTYTHILAYNPYNPKPAKNPCELERAPHRFLDAGLNRTPEQVRTAVSALRGQRPRPLDDGGQ